ncbi:MAG: TIGR04282 family arsenosugar biosynthesis glycosyltransferase [Planctomycetaceae bacterium]|nr:TIGR04282 family arsenosugar biosynthesis glycosyltransferase [Planctomycetaceae bacterium]
MRTLGMFARRPEPGKTKTRLAATVGNELAAALYAAFVEDLLARVPELADQFLLAVTPDSAQTRAWFERQVPEAAILPQPDCDLGGRIDWFFRTAAEQGGSRIVLIGSDSPDLPSGHITAAFAALQESDLVLSPASDGGYVLIGLRQPNTALFEDIPWSSAATLSATLERAAALGLATRLIAPWYDIDTIQNLGTLWPLQNAVGHLPADRPHPDSRRADCPRTLATLQQHAELVIAQLQQH